MSVLVEEAVMMVLSSVDDDTADLSTVLAHLDHLHLPNSDSAKAPLRMILALSLRSEPTWSARYSAHTGRPCRKWPMRRNAAIPLSPPPTGRDASLVSLSTSLAALSAEAARPPPASPPRPVISRVPLVSMPLPRPMEAPLAMTDLGGGSVAPPRVPPVVARAPPPPPLPLPPPPPPVDYAAPLAALETLVLQATATSLLAPVPAQPPKPPPPSLLSTPSYTQALPGQGLNADSLFSSRSSGSGISSGNGKGVAFAGGSGDDNDVVESDTPALAQSIHAIRDWSLGSGSQAVGPDGRVVAGFSPGAFSQWRTLGRSFKRWVSAVVFSKKAREVADALERAREATAAEWGRAKFMRRMFKTLVEGVVERRVERGKLCVALEHWSVVTQTKVVRAWAGVVAAERPIPLRNPVAIGALFHWITLTLPDRGVWWKPGAAAAMAASVRGLSITVPPPPHLYHHHYSRGSSGRGGEDGVGGLGQQLGGATWRVKDREALQREGEDSSHHHHHHHSGSEFLGGVVSEDDSPWLYTEAEEADAAALAHVKRLDTLPSRVLRRIGPPPHKLHCLEGACAVVDGGLAASCFGAWRVYAAGRVAWSARVVKGALSRVLVTWRRGAQRSVGVRGCGVRRCVRGAREFLARLRVKARVNGAQRAECAVAEAVRTRGCVLRALAQWRGALRRVRTERGRACLRVWRRECVLLPRFTAACVAHRERELLVRALGAWGARVREEGRVWEGLEALGVKAWGRTSLQRVRAACGRAVAMRQVVHTASQAKRVNSLKWVVSQWRGFTGAVRAAVVREGRVREVRAKGALGVWRGCVRGVRAGRVREESVATLLATRASRALSHALLTLASFAKSSQALRRARLRSTLPTWRYATALTAAHKRTLASVWRSRARRGLEAFKRVLTLSRLATALLTRRACAVLRAWAKGRLSIKARVAALRSRASTTLSRATLRAWGCLAKTLVQQMAQARALAVAHARATLLSTSFSAWRAFTQLRKARSLSLSKALHTCQYSAPLKAALGSWREALEEAKLEALLDSQAQGFWVRAMKGRVLHTLSTRVSMRRAWESRVVAATASLGRWRVGHFLRTLSSRATARRAWNAHVKACQVMVEDWKVLRALGVWRGETALLLRVRKGAMILAVKLGQAAEDRLRRVAWGAWVYRTQLGAIHSLVSKSIVGVRLTKGALKDWRLAALGGKLGREVEEGRARRAAEGAFEAWRRRAQWRKAARVCLTRVLVATPRAVALRACLGRWFAVCESLGCKEGSQRHGLRVWRARVAWVRALRGGVGKLLVWRARQRGVRALQVWRRRVLLSRLTHHLTLTRAHRATLAALIQWQSMLAVSQARKRAAMALCHRITRTSTLRLLRVTWGAFAGALREAQSKGVRGGVLRARGSARVSRACFQALKAYALGRVGHRGALGAACRHMGQWKASQALGVWKGAIGAQREMRVRVADGLGLGRSRRLRWALAALKGAVAVRKRGKLAGALARLHFEKVALPASLQALKDYVMRRRAGRAALGGLVSVVRGVVLRKGMAAWVNGAAAARECARLEAEAAERARLEAERVRREGEEAAERARLEAEEAAERVRKAAEEAAERERKAAEEAAERARREAEEAAERARKEAEEAAERVRKAAEEAAERERIEAERVRLEAEAAAALIASRLALLRRTFTALRTVCLRERECFEALHEEGAALVRRNALVRGLKALLASAGRAVSSRALAYLTRQRGLRRGLQALWGAVEQGRERVRVVKCVAAATRASLLSLALRRWCEALGKARIARAAQSASTHLRLSRALGLWYTWLEGVRRAKVGAQTLARRRGKRGLAALGAHLDRVRRDRAQRRAAAAVIAALKVARAVDKWRVATSRSLQLKQAERAARACIAAARYTLALNTWRAKHKATMDARRVAGERASGRVRGAFQAWVAATGAQKRLRMLGEGFGDALAQARGVGVLRAWRGALRSVREEASAVRRAGRHLNGVRGRKALMAWREVVGEARAARLARQGLARRARAALLAWRSHAQYLSQLRGIAEGVRARGAHRVGVRAVRVWRGAAKDRVWEARATRSATLALQRGMALRVLYAWWEVVREAKAARAELAAEADLRQRLEVLLARARARTMKLLFNAWSTRVRVSQRARALARERVMHGPVKRCFGAWCKFAAEHKALTLAAAELLERRDFSLLGRAWDALVEAKERGLGGGTGGRGGLGAHFVGDYMGGRSSPLLPDLRK